MEATCWANRQHHMQGMEDTMKALIRFIDPVRRYGSVDVARAHLLHTNPNRPRCIVQENARVRAASLALIKANQYPAYGEVRHLQSVEIADATLCEAREDASPATT